MWNVSPRQHTTVLPPQLRLDIEQAGYYPAFVADVVASAVAQEEVKDYLVHPETTFDGEEVRRHVTVLVITGSRLVVCHADDRGPDTHTPVPVAQASSEAVPLGRVRTVVLTHVVTDPARYRSGDGPYELTLTIGWGSLQRVDLEPATCPDPQCDADHGYTGQLATEDIVVRVSSDAEGGSAVQNAARFATELSAATGVRP